nr:hypothetical protein [Tanacetum cinerariifolium]
MASESTPSQQAQQLIPSSKPEQSLIPPSGEVNTDETTDKSLFRASKQPVTRPKAPIDLKTKKKKIPYSSLPKSPHKSLEASELAEKQGNQPSTTDTNKELEKIVEMKDDAKEKSMKIPTVEQLLDEIPKLKDQIMHDSDELAYYESMPKDDLRSVSGFEDTDSDDTQGNDVSHSDYTFSDHNAFAERLSLPDHLDHICKEVSSLHSKLRTMESSIIHQVSDGIKSTLLALGEPQSAEPLVESQGEQPANLDVVNKESAPPASDAKLNEGKELVVYNSEEKKSEEIILVKDDSDEDDKQSLSKRFKTMTLILNILNPTPINTFVPEHLLKPKEQQKELTPPRDSSKGKAVAIIEEPMNELVNIKKKEVKRLGLPPSPELATFGLTAENKKRKRTELIKEVFITKNVRVDGMDQNLIPPSRIMPIQGLVINELELDIFFMNGNTDIGFQREKIRLSVEEPLSTGLRESNIRRIQVKYIVKEVEDYLKTYSSAGKDIS